VGLSEGTMGEAEVKKRVNYIETQCICVWR
jgi:hypothetical protein